MLRERGGTPNRKSTAFVGLEVSSLGPGKLFFWTGRTFGTPDACGSMVLKTPSCWGKGRNCKDSGEGKHDECKAHSLRFWTPNCLRWQPTSLDLFGSSTRTVNHLYKQQTVASLGGGHAETTQFLCFAQQAGEYPFKPIASVYCRLLIWE